MPGGRPTTTIRSVVKVQHDGQPYAVVKVKTCQLDTSVVFVVDEDRLSIENKSHYNASTGYIWSADALLHRHILQPSGSLTVDHISQWKLDNRRANLRLATQTEQNLNTRKRKRQQHLPVDCGIQADDLPTSISYCAPRGTKAAHFAVEIRRAGVRIYRKATTTAHGIPLTDKLHEAKGILEDFKLKNPQHFVDSETHFKLMVELREQYNAIIKSSGIGLDDVALGYAPIPAAEAV